MKEIKIPKTHPRYRSLMERERLVEGFREGIVVPQGLIAHGRGEAFDYLIGEKTIEPAQKAIEAAAALLLISEYPVISVNGNAAALVGEEIVRLSNTTGIPIEVNLFYRSEERVKRIIMHLREKGARNIIECSQPAELPGLQSERRKVCANGILKADTVLVMMEDGDRTEALRNSGKNVIAVDLNPLSRTALTATITIVDNVTRAIPCLITSIEKLSTKPTDYLRRMVREYDNKRVLAEVLQTIKNRLERLSTSLVKPD
jgi:4-phosphopantoate--beta-alanine ligase